MAKLSPDTYTTRGRPSNPEQRDALVLFAYIFACCGLLVFSRLDLEPVRWLRWRLIGVVQPIVEVAAVPVSRWRQARQTVAASVDAVSENEKLRSEIQRLRGWEWRARELERKLAQVSVLARTGEETGLEFATGRVITDARGPFANGLLVNLGARHGIQPGFAAVSGDGLIGRVIDVGETAARILLLTDPNSRIPVLAGPQSNRAILKVDGDGIPRLTALAASPTASGTAGLGPTPPTLQAGDDVLTSGDDGLLPRGLKVGTVVQAEDGARVLLAARQHGLDFVSILFFKPPGLADAAGNGSASTRPTTRGKLEPTSSHQRPLPPGWPSQ